MKLLRNDFLSTERLWYLISVPRVSMKGSNVMAEKPIIALAFLVIGALLGGIIQAGTARYAAFRENQVIAAALGAEITALQDVVEYRKYYTYIEEKIERLQKQAKLQKIDPEDVVAIPIRGEYFIVFNATASKIGELPCDVATRVVRSYTLAKSLIEDIKTLWEIHQAVLANKKTPINRDRLLNMTIKLQEMFDKVGREGQETVPKLRKYSRPKWWLIYAVFGDWVYTRRASPVAWWLPNGDRQLPKRQDGGINLFWDFRVVDVMVLAKSSIFCLFLDGSSARH
jgi:hypothetical protein